MLVVPVLPGEKDVVGGLDAMKACKHLVKGSDSGEVVCDREGEALSCPFRREENVG